MRSVKVDDRSTRWSGRRHGLRRVTVLPRPRELGHRSRRRGRQRLMPLTLDRAKARRAERVFSPCCPLQPGERRVPEDRGADPVQKSQPRSPYIPDLAHVDASRQLRDHMCWHRCAGDANGLPVSRTWCSRISISWATRSRITSFFSEQTTSHGTDLLADAATGTRILGLESPWPASCRHRPSRSIRCDRNRVRTSIHRFWKNPRRPSTSSTTPAPSGVDGKLRPRPCS